MIYTKGTGAGVRYVPTIIGVPGERGQKNYMGNKTYANKTCAKCAISPKCMLKTGATHVIYTGQAIIIEIDLKGVGISPIDVRIQIAEFHLGQKETGRAIYVELATHMKGGQAQTGPKTIV
jgi:hypothetical protein